MKGTTMTFEEKKKKFELEDKPIESVILKFYGVEGFTVYNCSIPFKYRGDTYIYGRVEKFEEWMRSWIRLFKQTGIDEYTLANDSMVYQLEDPYIAIINDMLVMGGTHIKLNCGELDNFFGYFYKGTNLENMYYFTSGPDKMKDIRFVQLDDKIGVFSRPRGKHVEKKYGSGSVMGFDIVDSLDELTSQVIENAPAISNMFAKDEWGGCNQAYQLDSGMIGIIGHKSYNYIDEDNIKQLCYTNVSFVMNPNTRTILDERIIAVRSSFKDAPAKKPNLKDCAFASGIVMRDDGKVDLYSGIGDCEEGRIIIDYPFEGYGKIINHSMKII